MASQASTTISGPPPSEYAEPVSLVPDTLELTPTELAEYRKQYCLGCEY